MDKYILNSFKLKTQSDQRFHVGSVELKPFDILQQTLLWKGNDAVYQHSLLYQNSS